MPNPTKPSENIRRVLILGHSGFIGTRLVQYFQERSPDIEVIGKSFPPFDLTQYNDASELADMFDRETALIMLSAIKRQFADDLDSFLKNVVMVVNLCKVLQEHSVGRVIYFSSAAVYGEDIDNTGITEETPICPTSYYGMAKFTAERLLWKTISSNEQSSLLVLRPPTVYGPGDQGNTYGPVSFVKAAIEKRAITLWGDGEELRDFVFIDDIAAIVHRLVFNDYKGVLNIANGKSCSFKEILDIVVRSIPHQVEFGTRSRTKDKVDNVFLADRLLEVLPDLKFISMKEGVARMIECEGYRD
ncbi:NAD-dependent epimerase/dehydratase family protein [Verrucomicrobiota bacterium]